MSDNRSLEKCKAVPLKGELLHYEGITFVRNGEAILKGVHWHVKEEENWALLGLNGAGKSTLLSMIMAYRVATRGTLRVLGYTFGTCVWKSVKDQVGFVSSTLNTFDRTLRTEKVEDIILSGRYGTIGIYQDVTEAEREEALRIMSRLRIDYLKGKEFQVLSTGEQRRVLIGRAFMNQPKLLILDEPCNGLDVPSREQFLQVLEKEIALQVPYVYVTHQVEEIMPSITHVAILQDGVIVKAGRKNDVINSTVLSQLYGMNVRIEWNRERPWLIVDDGVMST